MAGPLEHQEVLYAGNAGGWSASPCSTSCCHTRRCEACRAAATSLRVCAPSFIASATRPAIPLAFLNQGKDSSSCTGKHKSVRPWSTDWCSLDLICPGSMGPKQASFVRWMPASRCSPLAHECLLLRLAGAALGPELPARRSTCVSTRAGPSGGDLYDCVRPNKLSTFLQGQRCIRVHV